MKRVVVIGAGVGGLTTAAVLARMGVDVTVLEAQVYPGGCAGTFHHQGYRFDAGATLAAGFYPGGPMDLVANGAGIQDWGTRPAEQAMVVHLPDGVQVPLTGGEDRWAVRRQVFGSQAERFFHWQERTADSLWDLALRLPPWPPQSPKQLLKLLAGGISWLGSAPRSRFSPGLLADALRPVAAHLKNGSDRLRLFIDAQLLISAQTTSLYANALYGASALDLPRRGVVHLEGGMGSIAQNLVRAVREHGGRVLYRHEVTRIAVKDSRPVEVRTKGGESFPAEVVIANLPLPNLEQLTSFEFRNRFMSSHQRWPEDGWGAFVIYLGVEDSAIPEGFPLHHQAITGEPLAEGSSLFLSISPEWDPGRAPAGHRAMTLSTHTALAPWWHLYENERPAYEARKAAYTERLLTGAERILPGLRLATRLALPGTPVTFQRFTRRAGGWVGGYPQTSLFRSCAPHLSPGLWLVGDSVFPGQSTAAVALGGLRVAQQVLNAEFNRQFSGAISLPYKGISQTFRMSQ